VTAETMSILDEMAHNQSMAAIRSFAFFLVKIFKSLYRRIYVNVDGVQKVGSVMIYLFPTLIRSQWMSLVFLPSYSWI